MVPGLDESNVFVHGIPFQIERWLKARKAIVDWVGISKECKNSMDGCLTEGTGPKFKDSDEPASAKEGGLISKPQMKNTP